MTEVNTHNANVFLPGCLGPVSRHVVLADEHQEVVQALRAENERLSLLVSQADFNYDQDRAKWKRQMAELQALKEGAVPCVSAMARILADRCADACNVDREDYWKQYGDDCVEDVNAMLAAAPKPAEKAQSTTLGEFLSCKGTNCTSTDGFGHSAECEAEHIDAIAGGQLVQRAERQEPYAWFWSHGSDQGVLTLRQDYEQHRADYPGMTFTAVYAEPQPAQDVSWLMEKHRKHAARLIASRIPLVEALEKVKAATRIDDPHDHYDMVCNALAAHRAKEDGE